MVVIDVDEPSLMYGDEKLLNVTSGKLHRMITTMPNDELRGILEQNLEWIKIYLSQGSSHEQTLARMACQFVIDHADQVISFSDKQKFAEVTRHVLLGTVG